MTSWGAISKQLRIWDYAVTYRPYYGLPLSTVHTYPTDYRYFAEHNVEGIFTEHEYPILADMRDLKVWMMMMKLLEDPQRNYSAMLLDFTDGFYGPAGKPIRQYLDELQREAEETASNVDWFPALSQYGYLTLDFVDRAHDIFDEAEKAVADNPVLLRRVRHARMPLDRASLVLWPELMRAWIAGDEAPEAIPLDREAVAFRSLRTPTREVMVMVEENKVAAYHQAGHAVVAYVSLDGEHRGVFRSVSITRDKEGELPLDQRQ